MSSKFIPFQGSLPFDFKGQNICVFFLENSVSEIPLGAKSNRKSPERRLTFRLIADFKRQRLFRVLRVTNNALPNPEGNKDVRPA